MANSIVKSLSTTKFSKKQKIIAAAIGVILFLIILIALFSSPSAQTVFGDMNETMLKTKTVAIKQSYSGKGSTEGIDMNSTAYIDLTNTKQSKARGDFSVEVTSESMPMTVEADYIVIGSDKYIKFKKLSSTNTEIQQTFSQIESKIKNKWIIAREGDSYTTFVDSPVESVSTILPTPFANLAGDQLKAVQSILQDESTYTIDENSKVELSGVSAFKYSITYNKDQYDKFAKLIAKYNSFFKASTDKDNNEIKSYEVWVDSSTERIAKIEYSGTSTNGDIEAKLTFNGYDKEYKIEKPTTYYIESELIK